jgi:GT2 family glycosyltransferase
MDLSIIIVSWNVASYLEKCLQSIFENPPNCLFEVWVVDNASSDQTIQMVQTCFPQVNLITNTQNVGFAPANNQAIQQSTGRYVLLLNPDTIIHPHALQTLVEFMDTHPEAGGAGSLYLSPNGEMQYSCMPFPTVKKEFWRLFHLDIFWHYGTYNMNHWERHKEREVESLQGACLILRRTVLDEVGLLDPEYFMYTEEVDLCFRIHQKGWKLFWVPQAIITHFGGQSTRQTAREMFLWLYRSKIMFIRKHFGEKEAWRYKQVIRLGALVRIWLGPLISVIKPSSDYYRKNIENYKELLKQLAVM